MAHNKYLKGYLDKAVTNHPIIVSITMNKKIKVGSGKQNLHQDWHFKYLI